MERHPLRLAGETANRRVGRVAECTSPLTRQAVRLRRFESSTLCNFIGIWNNRILSKIASHRRFLKKHRQHRHRRGYIRNSPSIYCDPDSHLGDRSNSPRCKKVPAEEIVTSVLHYARYYRPIGDIAAVLILGAKNLIEYRTIVQEKRYLFGLIRRKTETTIKVDKKAELAKIILENVSPTTLFNVVVQRLQDMEIGSFSPLPLPCQRQISSNPPRKW